MKISQELHEYAGSVAENGMTGSDGNGRKVEATDHAAAPEGLSADEVRRALDEKAEEFREKGGEIYVEEEAEG